MPQYYSEAPARPPPGPKKRHCDSECCGYLWNVLAGTIMPPKRDGQCITWDFTLFAGQRPALPPSADVIAALSVFCKAYAFQHEKCGETGRDHYQGRIKLKEKLRELQVANLFHAADALKGAKLKRTSTENASNMFYVTKTETRHAGPWTDQDKPVVKKVQKMLDEGLRPWQATLEAHLSYYDDRIIDVVIDREGNSGKSSFKKWMWIHHDAGIVPPLNDAKDICQFCMSQPDKRLYIMDLPRAMKKRKLFELYAGIEQLKDGWLFDTRYHGRTRLMDEPRILIMTNQPPKQCYLSADRWKMWTITDDRLVPFSYS